MSNLNKVAAVITAAITVIGVAFIALLFAFPEQSLTVFLVAFVLFIAGAAVTGIFFEVRHSLKRHWPRDTPRD